MKGLVLDTENSYATAAIFNRFDDRGIPAENILTDWAFHCAAWKLLGSKKVESVSVLDDPKRFKKDHLDDFIVVKTLFDVLSSVDFIIGHNIDNFDLKKFAVRASFHGLGALPPIKTVDTYKIAKKHFAFTSNSLDFLLKFYGEKEKFKTSHGLWLKALKGEPPAFKELVDRCEKDVLDAEKIYKEFLPFITNHPNYNAYNRTIHNCPNCNSTRTTVHKHLVLASGAKYTQYQCKDCGKYSKGAQIEKPQKGMIK